jgi:hypothetical protein
VAVALSVGACSGGGDEAADPGSPRGVLAAAPARTIEAGSSKVALVASLEGQTRGTFDGQGELEFGAERGRLEVDLAPLGLAGEGRTMVLLDGDVVYIELGRRLPGLSDRPWVRIDLDGLKDGQGDNIEALRQLKANDPSAVLNALRGVTGQVTEVGAEDVRGTPTTHYRATVDLNAAKEASPESARDDLDEVVRQLGTERLPVEAWVDAEGRLRRLRYTVDLADLADDAPAKGVGEGRSTATLELYEFGAPVTFQAPGPSEVTDLAELLGTGAAGR